MLLVYWLTHLALFWTTLTAASFLALPVSPIPYGAPATVGPAREPCQSEANTAQAIVLTPQQDWQQALHTTAQPGDTFLLRGGVYAATDKLWLKAGAADAPITLKPYNCEAVTLYTSIRPNSYNTIAGLRIEAQGIDDLQWVVRFDGKNEGALAGIILRNNIIVGGTIDAIRISGDVQQVEVSGNHIDGGRDGHTIFVTAEGVATVPTQILITANLLTKAHFVSAAEDMLQVRDVGQLEFSHNTCTDGADMEQCVDIKNTTQPLYIAYNLFAGDQLHRTGTGEDHAGGCMVIHEEDGVADQQVVEYNLFRHCTQAVIRFATGEKDVVSSALVRYNVFLQSQASDSVLVLERASNTTFLNNTFIYAGVKLGNSAQTRLPQNTVIKNNIFYHSAIKDNTPGTTAAQALDPASSIASTYQCLYNLFYQLDGGFTHGNCQATVAAEPHFVNISTADFRLQATSPAVGSGENGSDIGAFAALLPLTALNVHVHLPLILSAP